MIRGTWKLTIDCNINNISTRSGSGDHTGSGDTCSVVGVDVDREVGVLLTDGTDERRRSLRLEEASHILNAQNMDTLLDELVDKVEVVLEGVLGLLRVGNITAVANGSLDDTASLLRGIDTKTHLQYTAR